MYTGIYAIYHEYLTYDNRSIKKRNTLATEFLITNLAVQ